MDNLLAELMQKKNKHFAEVLEIGDRCLATIRHKTDGSKNKINVKVILVENNIGAKEIKAAYRKKLFTIPYNELSNG